MFKVHVGMNHWLVGGSHLCRRVVVEEGGGGGG